ncbi:MAG: thrombospondin type 3 repeat-containing protein [Chitinophagales bacterium]
MRKSIVLAVSIFLCSTFHTQAQNSDHPIKFGVGANGVDYNTQQDYFGDLSNHDAQNSWVAGRYTLGGTLNPSFSLEAAVSMVSIMSPSVGNPGQEDTWLDMDLTLHYHFANGYMLSERSWFAPYLYGGVGYNYLGSDNSDAATWFPEGKFGLGIDLWVTQTFGFNVQSGYTKQFDAGTDYAHHAIGIIIRFGNGKDTDGDGFADWEDACPDKAGIAAFNGCPDTDGDGITDASDACPTEAGPAAFDGCPDSDNDGLADKDDACPNEKGLMQFNGCPDTDGDGIADKDDRCPKDKGLAEFQGCPDSDGDGIPDLDDACKNEKGLAKFNGCPDTDGDGIADKDDRCPRDRGDMALGGCPDNDGDGIPDIDDRCPDKPGNKLTGGCPVLEDKVKKEIVEKINFAAKSIQFETGSDVIRQVSYTTLDNIVSIMKLYPSTSWSIEGHTDNVGDDAFNQELSDKRAASVRNYFISKGVEARERLSSPGNMVKPGLLKIIKQRPEGPRTEKVEIILKDQ